MALRLLESLGGDPFPISRMIYTGSDKEKDLPLLQQKQSKPNDMLKLLKPPDTSTPVAELDPGNKPPQQLNAYGKALTNPAVAAAIDALAKVVSGTTNVNEAEALRQEQAQNLQSFTAPFRKIPSYIPPILDYGKKALFDKKSPTFSDFAVMAHEGLFPLVGTPFASPVSAITSAIHGTNEEPPRKFFRKPQEVLGSAMAGYVKPETAPRLLKGITDKPLTEWERSGGTARLIPRAIAEATETVALMYMLGIPRATKNAIKSKWGKIKAEGVKTDFDAMWNKVDPNKVYKAVEKQGLFPKKMPQADRMQAVLDKLSEMQNRMKANPEVGQLPLDLRLPKNKIAVERIDATGRRGAMDVLMERQTPLKLLRERTSSPKEMLGNKRGAAKLLPEGEGGPKKPIIPIPVSLNDIDFHKAYAAHAHTSFSPDKRAKTEQEDYVWTMEKTYEELEPHAKTEAQQEILKSELERFKEGYIKRFNELLGAKSKTLSSMITGPANFPTARNERALNRERAVAEELDAWLKKAKTSIRRKLQGQEIEERGGEFEVAKQELAKEQENLTKMKAVNAIVRKKNLSQEQKIKKIMETAGFDEANAKKLFEPDFVGRTGFASYALTNTNSRIKRLQEKISKMEVADSQSGITPIGTYGKVKVVNNFDEQRVQIDFGEKPAPEVISDLKRNGWRWSPRNKVWQRQNTRQAVSDAERLVSRHYGEAEKPAKGGIPGGRKFEDIQKMDMPEFEKIGREMADWYADLKPEQRGKPEAKAIGDKLYDLDVYQHFLVNKPKDSSELKRYKDDNPALAGDLNPDDKVTAYLTNMDYDNEIIVQVNKNEWKKFYEEDMGTPEQMSFQVPYKYLQSGPDSTHFSIDTEHLLELDDFYKARDTRDMLRDAKAKGFDEFFEEFKKVIAESKKKSEAKELERMMGVDKPTKPIEPFFDALKKMEKPPAPDDIQAFGDLLYIGEESFNRDAVFSYLKSKDMTVQDAWLDVHGKEKQPTQKQKVAEAVKEEPKSIKEVAEETKILEPNVRRILGVGAKEGTFTRVDNGVYILNTEGKDIAWIHAGDAREVLPRLAKEGQKVDMAFLDIPYKTAGVKGGNRGINFAVISPEEFATDIVEPIKAMVRTEDSPIVYMYSNSKSGYKDMMKYNRKIMDSGLKVIAQGTYTKTYKSGKPMMFGRYPMPPEGIIVFNKSGNNADVAAKGLPDQFDIKAIAPLYKGHYQTEKAIDLLRKLIMGTTEKGDTVLDPFSGSGVTLEQAIEAGRKAVGVEISKKAIEEHIKPRIEKAADRWTWGAEPAATIPNEPIEFLDADANLENAKAALFVNEEGKYYVKRDDGTFVYNPETESALFEKPDDAKKLAESDKPPAEAAKKFSVGDIVRIKHPVNIKPEFRGMEGKISGITVGDEYLITTDKGIVNLKENAIEAAGGSAKPPAEPPKTTFEQPEPKGNPEDIAKGLQKEWQKNKRKIENIPEGYEVYVPSDKPMTEISFDGNTWEVLTIEETTDIPEGMMQVYEVVKPAIYYNDSIVSNAQIIARKGISKPLPEYESPEDAPVDWDDYNDDLPTQLDHRPIDLEEQAQMEIEMLAMSGGLDPLEHAMKQVGKIAPYAKGHELEEYRQIPQRFRSAKNGRPLDERRDQLNSNHYMDFGSDSELIEALKALGDNVKRYRLSDEVVSYLKAKANADKLGKKLAKTIPPRRYKSIIEGMVKIRKTKTPITIKTSEEKLLKDKLQKEGVASRRGEKAGKKDEAAKYKQIVKEKAEELKRKGVMQLLKHDIIARDAATGDYAKMEAKLKDRYERLKRQNENGLLKEDIRRRTELDRLRQYFRDKELREKSRKRLTTEIKKMIAFIKDVPTKNLPLEYKDAIEEIKDSVDFDNVRLTKVIRQTKIAKQIEDETLQKHVKELDDITAGNMTIGDLRQVYELIQILQHEGSIKNKFLTVEKGKEFEEAVVNGVESIDASGGIPQIPNIEKVEGWGDKSKELKSKFIAENRRPEAIIESFDNYKGDGQNYNALFKPANEAANKKLENIDETSDKLSVIFKDINIAADLGKRVKVAGIKRPITRDEMLFIYANSFNEINLEHLVNSGVSEETIYDVERKLSDQEKDAVHKLFEYYDGDQYDRIDAVFSALKGIHLPKEENYFPIQNLENIGDIEAIEMDIKLRQDYIRAGIPSGFLKERTGGKKAFKKFSFFKAVYKNITQVEHYISHAEAVRDVSKYLRNPNIKESIVRNFGQPVYDVLDRWIQDVARGRGRNEGDSLDDLAVAFRGNFVMYALGANLSTVLKQPASFIQGAEYIGKTKCAISLMKFSTNPIEMIRFVEGKSTQMRHRRFTQERELQEILSGRGIARRFHQKDLREIQQMIREGVMQPIMWADKMTVTILWKAAYDSKFAETGSEKAAIEWADKAIRRTQPQSRIADLPDFFRAGNWKKMLTLFKNQPNQNFNLIYDSYRKYQHDTGDKATSFKKFSSEIFFYLVASGLFFDFLSRHRLPKKFAEVALALANQMFGGLPIIGSLIRKVQYPWGSDNMIDGILNEGAKVITSKKASTKLKHAGRLAGQVAGVPGYVAAERALTRESLQTKLVGGEKKKSSGTNRLRLLGGASKSGSRSKTLRLLQ